jgi:hypothetical protein
MLMARSGHKGISRIDHKKRNTHGWYVRVTFQGTTHSKLFSDSVHGGEEKALQRAIRYRNKLEREVGRPRTDRTVVSKVARSNTGIQGVNRIWKGTGEAYEVTWSPSPTSFSAPRFQFASTAKKRRSRRQSRCAASGKEVIRCAADLSRTA